MNQALSTRHTCVHCGSEFLPTLVDARFCCQGCEFVFAFLQDNGLQNYYELRKENPPLCPVPAPAAVGGFAMFDDPEFVAKFSSGGDRLRFYVEGLNCTACLWLLEKLPSFCRDVEWCRVEMGTSTVEVKRASGGSFANAATVLSRLGFRIQPLRTQQSSEELSRRENRLDLIRIGVAGAATGNIMILAVSIYGGAGGQLAEQFRLLSAMLALPVLTFCAWPFYRSTFYSLRSRHLNLDVPIVAAILAGVIASVWGLLADSNDIYFDSLSMLVFLLLSSRFVLKRVQSSHLRPTGLEEDLLLSTVTRIIAGNHVESISSMAVRKGDRLVIEGDMMLPVDGTVEYGCGVIDVAVLTGESAPVDVSPGDAVSGGSRNLGGQWVLRVENPPAQTRLAEILRDTERSAASKSSYVRFSDSVSQWFIGAVFAIASGLVLFFASTDLAEGIQRALTLVIVTCPCVFGIAIPLSMSLAIRSAARRGIVIKDSNTIERLWSVRQILFDKTGTLTTGEMSVERIETTQPESLGLALGLEKEQSHPVAKAIVHALRGQGVLEATVSEVATLPGGGVSGRHGLDHLALRAIDKTSAAWTPQNVLRGNYALFINDQPTAYFELHDRPRVDAGSVIEWFRRRKFQVRMLSGDRRKTVFACGRLLGFADDEILAEATPEQKAAMLHDRNVHAAMVGDGANDAAALAAADVGIAICGSLEASLRAADVYLVRPSLSPLIDLFEIARKTKAAIYRNLTFSVLFNVVSGVLAVFGWMNPLWAAVLMPLSSLTILISATWTGRWLLRPRRRL